MNRIIVMDFETYYDSKTYTLSKMSAVEYVRDPRFNALMLGVSVNGKAQVIEHDNIPKALEILNLTDPETLLVGHNSAGFDNLILSEVYNVHPAFMTDTMHMLRWSGISRISRENLASVVELLKVGHKRKGTVISDGKRTKADFTEAQWRDFVKYCSEDVEQTGKVMKLLMPYMTLDSIIFSSITCKMATEPVFNVDANILQEYLTALAQKEAAALEAVKKTFNFETTEEFLASIRSVQRVAKMLKELNCEVPVKLSEKKSETKRKKILERGNIPEDQITPDMYEVYDPALAKTDLEFLALQDHPDARVRELVKARLELNSSIAKNRALSLMTMANYNKPMPILLKCYYAHTSRYGAGASEGASDGINIQNLPKHDKTKLPLRRSIKVSNGYKVVACDSSQIEARCLAYEANFTDLLDQFREKRDPYSEVAEKFGFGVTAKEIHDGAKAGDTWLKTLRNAGKKAILSAGYGVGSAKFANALWNEGTRLAETKAEHDNIAAQIHAIYRKTSKPIVNFWSTCGQVISNLYGRQTGTFGGPDYNLFTYGFFSLPTKEEIASIKMPSGFLIRYPGIDMQLNEKQQPTFIYNRKLGSNFIPTKLYGGSVTENCIAEGTLILTDNGWKPIETVGLSDKVYDGLDFVSHKGVVSKGIQNCIELEGVFLTPDHKVLITETNNGRTAQLVRPLWENAPQFQGYNRSSFWKANRYTQAVFQERPMVLGTTMRMWGDCNQSNIRTKQSDQTRVCPSVSIMSQQGFRGQAPYAWYDQYSDIQCMALDAITLRDAYISYLSALWGTWDNCMRALAQVREFLCRYVSNISTWFSTRQNQQRWQLLSRELPLDNLSNKQSEPSKNLYRSKHSRTSRDFWNQFHDNSIPCSAWVAAGTLTRPPRLSQWEQKLSQPTYVQKEVFDIVDCGTRHCFAVNSSAGGMVVHNCTQSFAFQILMWQACRMTELGIKLHANIHDSFASVVPDKDVDKTVEIMLQVMHTTPPWAKGLPLAAEAEVGTDFTVV